MTRNRDSYSAKLGRAAAQLPYFSRALGLVWAAAPRWTVAWVLLLVAQGFLPAATVYLTRALVNSLVLVVSSHGSPEAIRPALLLALLMGLIMLLTQVLGSLTAWVRASQGELVSDYVRGLVHRQSVALDLAFYDQPEYFDHLHRARDGASYRTLALLESTGGLFQNGITLVAMAAILLQYGPLLPVALFLSTLPALYVVLHYRVQENRRWLGTTADERRSWYYDWVLTAREAAAELRLFGLGSRFQGSFQEVRRHLREERLRLTRNEGFARVVASSSGLLVTGAAMLWMVWQAIQGAATLGDVAMFYAAFSQGQGLMRSALENLGQIYSSSLFLGDLFEFLALVPQVVDAPTPRPSPEIQGKEAPAIRFRGVTFRYPAGRRAVLQDLDLDIAPGQVAGIVGPNGAGKSTLIKLLCRFYDPEAGQVELGGVDLRELPLEGLRRSITVLFQEPVQYNATAAENIAIGSGEPRAGVEGAHGTVSPLPGPALPSPEKSHKLVRDFGAGSGESATIDEIEAAARAAGADGPIARLPQGYHTLLGTWFEGGTDLSVGEWQRIALARAFLRRAPVVILDEPTSSMDSWAEADWLQRFRALVAGRTAIVITHRFTTARYADVIHVMDQGHIVESGSHEELLALGGRYAASWHAQMQEKRDPAP